MLVLGVSYSCLHTRGSASWTTRCNDWCTRRDSHPYLGLGCRHC